MAKLLEVLGVADLQQAPNPPTSNGRVNSYRDPNFPQYIVLSFNGSKKPAFDPVSGLPLEGQTAVGFAYDSTGEDPDFYVLVPGHDAIPLVKGVDFSGLKQGLGMPILTEAERDESAAYFGRVALNSSTGELNYSDGASAWQKPTHTPA